MTEPPSGEQIKRWRAKTLRKLGNICSRIADLKAGLDVRLASIAIPGTGGKPGETPLERLERFKRLLNATLARLAEGQLAPCAQCDQAIPVLELDEMPWADVCGACAADPP